MKRFILTTLVLMVSTAAQAQEIYVTDFQTDGVSSSTESTAGSGQMTDFYILVEQNCYTLSPADFKVLVRDSKATGKQIVEIQSSGLPHPDRCNLDQKSPQALVVSTSQINVSRPIQLLNQIRLAPAPSLPPRIGIGW